MLNKDSSAKGHSSRHIHSNHCRHYVFPSDTCTIISSKPSCDTETSITTPLLQEGSDQTPSYKGDSLTLSTAVAEFIQTVLGTFLTFVPTIDHVCGLEKDTPFGSLSVSIAFGILSVWVAWETADAHRLVNKANEADYQPRLLDETNPALFHVKWRRKIKLVGDRIGHTGEYSGVLNAFFILLAADRLNRWGILAGSVVILAIGYRMSFSDARTCKHAHHHSDCEHTADTNIDAETFMGLVGAGSRTFFVCLIFLGMLSDKISGLTANTVLDVSATNLITASIASTLLTACMVYCERALNMFYQTHGNNNTQAEALKNPNTQPSVSQNIALAGSSIGLGINFSATIMSFLIQGVAIKNGVSIGLDIGLTAVGCLLTSAYVRSYANKIRYFNTLDQASQSKEKTLCCSMC